MRRMKCIGPCLQAATIFGVSLPDGVRSLDVLESCRSQGVTFMPGSVFDVDEMDDSHIRLNFVRPDAADIDTGIRIIWRDDSTDVAK